jgi:hypothetical protein
MSPGDAPAPASPDQVTAPPPDAVKPAGDNIPLPPIPADVAVSTQVAAPAPIAAAPKPPASPKFVGRLRVFDVVLAGLLLAFAFEAACFRATNADLFLHLAAGRAVAEGKLLAPDPFSFTTDATWVNHSWLPDLVAYHLYRIDGTGAALVALKALCVAVLAVVMLRTASQRGRLQFIPVLCVLLAVLTLSPRVFLQSAVLSMLLLGVTLWLLERARGGHKPSLWLLPLVCLLWVNLDAWFLLGPLTVGLYLLGELLQRVAGEEKEAPALSPVLLGVALAACLAACVVNPFHVRAFALPAALQFNETATTLAKEPQFRHFFLAPWEDNYFHPRIGLSAAGLAYFALLLAGLASFAMTAPRWRWWRVLVWLAFAALSLFSVVAIPFFAVVAGPITALNFLDGAARFFGAEVKGDLNSRQLAVVSRLLSAVAAVALLLLCVPGWLQNEPHQLRELGLGVHTDEGLRNTAEQVARWRHDGVIAEDAHVFNLSPDAAAYFAWFCPGQKTFLDHRVVVFPAKVAEDYRTARMALQGQLLPKDDEKQGRGAPPWRGVFAKKGRKIDFVVFHTRDVLAAAPTLQRLYSNPREFTPCHVDGAASVFAWRDPDDRTPAPPDPRLRVAFDELAFGGKDVAPTSPPPPRPTKPWYYDLLPHGLPDTRERDAAMQYRERFDGMYGVYRQQSHVDVLSYLLTTQLGAGALMPPLHPVAVLPLLLVKGVEGMMGEVVSRRTPMGLDRDMGPPDSLYLAIRAARRGLRANRDDALAYRTLAEAYARFRPLTREGLRGSGSQAFSQVRQAQVTAALREALACDPSPEVARGLHLQLADAFENLRFLDLQAKHLGEYLKLLKGSVTLPGASAKQMKERVEDTEKRLNKLETELKTNRNVYAINSSNKKLLQVGQTPGQVEIAMKNGLAETALELLMENQKDVDRYGAHTALNLVLMLGRLDLAWQVLGEDAETRTKNKRGLGVIEIGMPAYEWYSFQAAAAGGDYDLAFEHLTEAMRIVSKEKWVWDGLAQLKLPADERIGLKDELQARHLADLTALLAWLKLEVGDVQAAASEAKKSERHSLALPVRSKGSVPMAQLIGELADPAKRRKPRE